MKKTRNLQLALLILATTSCNKINDVATNTITTERIEVNENIENTEKFEEEIVNNVDINNIFNSINEMKKTIYRFENYFKCINLGKKECTVYKLFGNENKYEGYIIIDEDLNVLTMYFGEYEPVITNENKYIIDNFDFVTYDEYSKALKEKEEYEKNNQNDLNFKKGSYIKKKNLNIKKDFPCERSDLKIWELSSFHFRQVLTQVPEYYNFPYGPVDEGCAPTAGAMLIAYYDMHSNLKNLVDGDMPLMHGDNKQKVDDLIIKLASKDYMSTNLVKIKINGVEETVNGTPQDYIVSGLTKYLNDRGYGNYVAREISRTVDYDDFCYLIGQRSNPFLLRAIKYNEKKKNEEKEEKRYDGHRVLCHGYSRIRYSGDFAITRFNHTDKKGDYYLRFNAPISEYKVTHFKNDYSIIYITKK